MSEKSQETGADRRAVLAGAAALALGAIGGRAVAAGDGPVAQTAYGAVQGDVDSGIAVFKGVPYGAPTGGSARFMPPQPPQRWSGVRQARKFGDQCPQVGVSLPKPFAPWTVNTGESEDCLALNVWTPAVGDGKRRPVMVWLHGGGFTDLNGSALVFDGVNLCKRGDVVVVTLNHRLNLFGYLYLAQLAGPQFAASGNVGELDQIAALRWVQANIAAFGGDPDRVTIFGESGGGLKVSTLMAMPAAGGLFHRAAIQSGPGLTAISPDAATATAVALCRAVGVSEHDAGGLQHTDAGRLTDALRAVMKSGEHSFGPVIDGANLPGDPFTPGAPAVSASVPMIIGSNATETTVLAPLPGEIDMAGLKNALAPRLPGADLDGLIASFRGLYPDAGPADLYYAITTDRIMGADTIAMAERKAALAAAPAYLYRLEFETPVDHLRAPHGLDLPLVFDNVAKSASLLGPVAAQAQVVADQMSAAWIAFAHTGSPNAAGLASWPRYDTRSRSTMVFNTVSRAVNDPESDERRIIGALPGTV